MSKILLGVIGILLIIGYFLWNENSRLSALKTSSDPDTDKLRELIDKHPQYFDIKMRAVYFIFIISILVLLYISVDSIRMGYSKQ